jgi:hypothetical protein
MLDMWHLSKGRLEEMQGEADVSSRILHGDPANDAAKAAPIRRARLFLSFVVKALIHR